MNDRFKYLLTINKISQSELAKKWGKRPQQISDLVNGHSNIGMSILNNIIETFPEIDVNWLMTGQGEMLKQNINIEGKNNSANQINSSGSVSVGGDNKDELIKQLKEENKFLKEQLAQANSLNQKLMDKL